MVPEKKNNINRKFEVFYSLHFRFQGQRLWVTGGVFDNKDGRVKVNWLVNDTVQDGHINAMIVPED